MKLQSFIIQSAVAEGRYEEAIRLMLQHFGISLPDAQLSIKIETDIGYGIRAWVGSSPFEWYEGNFFFPSPDWTSGKVRVEVIAATVWMPGKNEAR